MVNINLLPDELRKKEEKEREAVSKTPKIVEFKMTNPASDKPAPPKKPPLVTRLFANKPPIAPPVKKEEPLPSARPASFQPYKEVIKINLPVGKNGDKYKMPKIKMPPEERKISVIPQIKPHKPAPKITPAKPDEYKKITKPAPVIIKAIPVPPLFKQDRFSLGKWLKNFFGSFGKMFRSGDRPKLPPLPPRLPVIKTKDIKMPEVKLPPVKVVTKMLPPTPQPPSPPPPAPVKIEEKFVALETPELPEKNELEEMRKIVVAEINKAEDSQTKDLHMPEVKPLGLPKKEEKKEIKAVPTPASSKGKKHQFFPKSKDFVPKKESVKLLDINLIPEGFGRRFEAQLGKKILGLAISAVASCLIIVVASLIISHYKYQVGNDISAVAARIKVLNQKIDEFETNRIKAEELDKYMQSVEKLLGEHLYWTKFFDTLEKYTIDEVYYTGFTASDSGSLVLSAVGKDYKSVARQLKVLQEASDFVQNVQINGATAATNADNNQIESVNFTISLNLIPDVYLIKFKLIN